MEQDIASFGAQTEDKLARTEPAEIIYEFIDDPCEADGTPNEDKMVRTKPVETEFLLDDDAPKENKKAPNRPQKKDKNDLNGAENKEKEFATHYLYKTFGASKQGKMMDLCTGKPCSTFTFLGEKPLVRIKDNNGVECAKVVNIFVWECWNGKKPLNRYVVPINKDIKEVHLDNFKVTFIEGNR